MPPIPHDQAQPHGAIHPLLRGVAGETRALLLRLLAYVGVLAGVVLIAMELLSGSEATLAEFADYITKTKGYDDSARAEPAPIEAANATSKGDRAPTADAVPDRAAAPQTSSTGPAEPTPRDRMRRQRLLEPARGPASAPCRELGKEKGAATANRGRCDTTAAADWVSANEAPKLRGRI